MIIKAKMLKILYNYLKSKILATKKAKKIFQDR